MAEPTQFNAIPTSYAQNSFQHTGSFNRNMEFSAGSQSPGSTNFGYDINNQRHPSAPKASGGGSFSASAPPSPSPHSGIGESQKFVSDLQGAGRNSQFSQGAQSNGHNLEQAVGEHVEHSVERQGAKQVLKRVGSKIGNVFKGGASTAGDTAAAGDTTAAGDAATADAGATALPLAAPLAVAATGFALASRYTGHPSQQQPGQSRQSWVNQNISTGQFAPQASQELFHQEHPNANGGVMAHPGR